MNLKGTVTRVFTAKDSGFKILALKVEDLKTIPVEKRNPDYPDSVSVVGLLRGVEENYVIDVVSERTVLAVAIQGVGRYRMRI